jgi:N-succinyl-L-ornithine transcarbamylase
MSLKNFTSLKDVSDPKQLVEEVLTFKQKPFDPTFAKGLSLALLFFNPSLRTRLSTQRAAQLIGMDSIVLDVVAGWPLEFELGSIMNKGTSEHIKEAAAVVAQYANIIGVRSFPALQDRDADYAEPVLNAFLQYADRPIVNLESATSHPLQGLTDMVTIRENRRTDHPKVLLTWAPHPRALPQAVANSFAEWALALGYDLTISHPPGYELNEAYTKGAKIEYDPEIAYKNADFVYAKNWSSFQEYGQILSSDERFTVDGKKMSKTNSAYFMHCLPVRRNVVVTDQVIDSKYSLVIEQANNRTFSALTVLKNIISSTNT